MKMKMREMWCVSFVLCLVLVAGCNLLDGQSGGSDGVDPGGGGVVVDPPDPGIVQAPRYPGDLYVGWMEQDAWRVRVREGTFEGVLDKMVDAGCNLTGFEWHNGGPHDPGIDTVLDAAVLAIDARGMKAYINCWNANDPFPKAHANEQYWRDRIAHLNVLRDRVGDDCLIVQAASEWPNRKDKISDADRKLVEFIVDLVHNEYRGVRGWNKGSRPGVRGDSKRDGAAYEWLCWHPFAVGDIGKAPGGNRVLINSDTGRLINSMGGADPIPHQYRLFTAAALGSGRSCNGYVFHSADDDDVARLCLGVRAGIDDVMGR